MEYGFLVYNVVLQEVTEGTEQMIVYALLALIDCHQQLPTHEDFSGIIENISQ